MIPVGSRASSIPPKSVTSDGKYLQHSGDSKPYKPDPYKIVMDLNPKPYQGQDGIGSLHK